jgi:hypothetical protein
VFVVKVEKNRVVPRSLAEQLGDYGFVGIEFGNRATLRGEIGSRSSKKLVGD